MTTLAQRLRSRTWPAHRQVEATPFVRALIGGRIDRPAYCLLLASLHPIYAALEAALRRHAGHAGVAEVFDPALLRESALEQDLAHLHGEDWRDGLPPQPAALDYAARIETLGQDAPELLLAHAYVRYLGDLSGGQALRRAVSRSLGLSGPEGTRFYDFGTPGQAEALARPFRGGWWGAPPGAASGAAPAGGGPGGSPRHERLFDELERAREQLSAT